MKKLLPLLLLLLVASCTRYDDSEIRSMLASHESRLARLETLCSQLNTNIQSLNGIVEALQQRDYVTGVSPVIEDGKQIGYRISFANRDDIVLYHGKDGKAGYSPQLGVRQYTDGKWYWTLDGEWIRDNYGNMMPVSGKDGPKGANGTNGITPSLTIKDGYWYVSYDNGVSWTKLGKATGEDGEDGHDGQDGDSFFQSVTETEEAVILVLKDGTTITLEKKKKISISFETGEGLGILPEESRRIGYAVTGGSEATLVKAFASNGWRAKVIPETSVKGVIEVTAPKELTDDEIVVLVYDGESTTIMSLISFEKGEIKANVQSVLLDGAGGTVSVDIQSNLAISAVSSAAWLNCQLSPSTKALAPYTLKVSAAKNLNEEERAATVSVQDESGTIIVEIAVVQGVYDVLADYVDLTTNGETANCYLINKAGAYRFPIIKGNGYNGLILSGDTAELPGAVHARVVWQDADIIANLGVYKGNVVFETPSSWKKGNAVVAVTDADDTILWSWHIWSTDYVLGQGDIQVKNHEKTRTYDMMARTLGEVNGKALLYQFGRKDPFPQKDVTKLGSRGSLESSIKLPDTFFSVSGRDWCTQSRSDWWDAGNTTSSFSSEGAVLKGNKTIYDPCPAGYRVPPDDAFTNFTKTGQNTESESEINSPDPSAYSFFMNDKTYYFYTGNGVNTIAYTCFGGLNAATGEALYNIAYYYAAHPSSELTGRLLQFYTGAVKPVCTDYSRALAGSIRPVRDNVTIEKPYESTDYSMDGTMVQISKHSVGNGIKLLFVGDGFTDKDIASGYYDASMQKAADYFFNIEPYQTYKNRFDVVNMRVVSQTSVFDEQKRTAFQSYYAGGSHITGNLSAAFNRSISAFGTYQNVVIVVVMNSTKYAGTCYMVGNTTSVAFCPMSTAYYYPFETVIHHEAGGHGFANLGDEYSYSGTIPDSGKEEISYTYDQYGWYQNLDITNDASTIRWSAFLNDSNYSSSTGIYEGGNGYAYGVWRPTYDSCMNHMYGTFNAPSRYAIFKRIMERSGETWSWQKFVAYDVVNRGADAASPKDGLDPHWEEAPVPDPPVAIDPAELSRYL